MHFSKIALAAFAGSAAAVSICDKYTTALLTNNTAANQYALVSLLVKTAAVGNFTGGSLNPTLPGSKMMTPGFFAQATYMGQSVYLEPYFTGALVSSNMNGAPAAINWLDSNATLLATEPLSLGMPGTNTLTLLSHLVSFFGVLLGCSTYGQAGFPTYAGDSNMYNVHKYMDLSEAEFSYFIDQVGASALSFGASTADVDSVAMSLNTTFGYRCAAPATVVPGAPAEPQVMCIDESCPISPKPMAGCSGDDAVAGYIATMPANGTMSATAMASATATASTTASSSPAAFSAGAPRQTAAAGLIAAFGAVAAALL